MYHAVNEKGEVLFVFERPKSDLESVTNEFISELSSFNSSNSLELLRRVYNLVLLCEEPTKNRLEIERESLSLDIGKLHFYFHFDHLRNGEEIKLIPTLFDEARYFFHFLNAIKWLIASEIRRVSNHQHATGENTNLFKSLFISINDYKNIINDLSKEDKDKGYKPWFDLEGTWVREGRGNDSPSACGALLTILNDLGYYKAPLNPKKLREVASQDFSITIGKSKRLSDFRNATAFDELQKRLKRRKTIAQVDG